MERKKRSKGSVWEFCYANKIFGTFGDEIKHPGRNWSDFEDTHTHAAKLVVEIGLLTVCSIVFFYLLESSEIKSLTSVPTSNQDASLLLSGGCHKLLY